MFRSLAFSCARDSRTGMPGWRRWSRSCTTTSSSAAILDVSRGLSGVKRHDSSAVEWQKSPVCVVQHEASVALQVQGCSHSQAVSQSINQSVTKDVRFGLPMVNPNAAPLEIGNAASSEHSPLTLQSEGGHFLSGYPALWALVTACLCKPFVLAERPDLGCEKPSREEP